MNVIIEGTDNAGKSSLIEHLVSRIKFSVVHNTVDLDSASVLAKQAKEISRESNTLYDRSAVISEYIYRMVLGRPAIVKFDILSVKEVCDNAIVIFCIPPVEKCLASTKDEMQGVRENMYKLYEAYDRLVDTLNSMGAHFFVYDWTMDEPQSVLDYITESHAKWWKTL